MSEEKVIRLTTRPWHWWLYRFSHVLVAVARLIWGNLEKEHDPRTYKMPTRTTRCAYWMMIFPGIPLLLVFDTALIAATMTVIIFLAVAAWTYWQTALLALGGGAAAMALLLGYVYLYDRLVAKGKCPVVEFDFK